ncbi:MAG: hypothetical protein H7Z41_12540 [Cytophagales bacterium]|nr:hypothetical protein [Armatimonadota bacterium]
MIGSFGCGEAVKNSGEDEALIHLPGETSSMVTKAKQGALLPVAAGGSWQNRVTLRRMGSDGGQDPVLDNVGRPIPASLEKATLVARRPLAGGGSSVLIHIQQEKQAKPYRTETFRVDAKGIYLSAIGGAQSLTATPALPLVRYPVREGSTAKWTGTVQIGKSILPAQSHSRVAYAEEVSFAQRKVIAYRVDTMLVASINGRQAAFPMSRWFAPGVGMVRQRFLSGNIAMTKELVAYRIR